MNHGQGEDSVIGGEGFLEGGEVEPEVVGVEEFVSFDVLEKGKVGFGALGHFAEDQAVVAGADGEVSSFFVGFGAAGDFHREGSFAFGEPVEKAGVEGGAEVVAIGNEGVFDAVGEEAVEPAAAGENGVEVGMSGGTPLELGVLGPSGGGHGLGIDFGDLVLQHLDFFVLEGGADEGGAGVLAGGEGVHEEKVDMGLGFGAESGDLLCDEVEEGLSVFDLEETFCLLQTHAGAEAAVELDDHGLVEKGHVPFGMLAGDRQVIGNIGGGVDCLLAHEALVAGAQEVESAFEGSDCSFSETGRFHLFTKRRKITHRKGR